MKEKCLECLFCLALACVTPGDFPVMWLNLTIGCVCRLAHPPNTGHLISLGSGSLLAICTGCDLC